MKKGGPGIDHEKRKELLDTIALLSGYDKDYNKSLPDGTQPDVLRLDSRCGSIFLGEAKDTESPGCTATFIRLSNYMNWFRLITNKRRGSTFVVCFGDESHALGWKTNISLLAKKAGFIDFRVECKKIGDEAIFIWLKLCQ